jgi:hypothetical protein
LSEAKWDSESLTRLDFVYVDAVGKWWDPVIGDFTDEEDASARVDARVAAAQRREQVVGYDGKRWF